MSLEVKTKGLKASSKYISDLIANTDKNLNDALHIIGESIVDQARSNLQTNTNINSGTLLSSIRILDEGKNFIVIGTDLDYAEYIEYGRGPVVPINGEWLHWIDKQTGKDVFAKFAKAVEPMPFLEPAVISNTSKFQDVITENVAKIGLPISGNDQ
jgi:hypothetical protein